MSTNVNEMFASTKLPLDELWFEHLHMHSGD
jgi:hypothetical protein